MTSKTRHYEKGVGYVDGPRPGLTRIYCDLVRVSDLPKEQRPPLRSSRLTARRERKFVAVPR